MDIQGRSVNFMKSHSGPSLVKHVSSEQIQKQLKKARDFIAQARYRQAVGILNELLHSGLSLFEQLQVLGTRGYAYALWRKPLEAGDDLTRLLKLVQAEVQDLASADIDWEKERAQDTGYLAFLAAIYHLRGILRRAQQHLPEAIEDLTLSIYMSSDPDLLGISYFHRGCSLIQLGECPERALLDLQTAWESHASLLRHWLNIPASVFEPVWQIEKNSLYLGTDRDTRKELVLRFQLDDLKEEWISFAKYLP